MFIKARNDRLYPVSRVLSIGKPEVRRGEGITEVELEGEGPVEFYSYVIRDFLRGPVTAFAAQPETYLVWLDEETPDAFSKTLVIGWSASRDGRLYPVTAGGVNDGVDSDPFILTPDGQVAEHDGRTWDTLEVFLADQKQQSAVAAAYASVA